MRACGGWCSRPHTIVGQYTRHGSSTHVTGLRITSLCADLQTFHKTRKRPKGSVETFTGKLAKPDDYKEIKIESEDFGAVLLRLGDRTRGAFTVSQVAAGRKNRLLIEVYGSKCSATWDQEQPDALWIYGFHPALQMLDQDKQTPFCLHPGLEYTPLE